jgi:ABC-type transport system substrate-binding protein
MSRRLAVALATLAAGAGLLSAAALGSGARPASLQKVVVVGTTGNLDSIDPAIAYGTTSWWFEYATGAWLYNYRDGTSRLVPEVAKRFTVSKDGRTYRFFLRKGYRFSDGERVTARSFAYAIQRAKNKTLNSPAGPLITDRKTIDIVGVTARRLTLAIKLGRPAPTLLTTLAMPFFQAASSKLPLTRELINVTKVGDLPTAGPYTWELNSPLQEALIVRNPYYRGPRPRKTDGVDIRMLMHSDDCYNQTLSGEIDIGCVPPNQLADVADQYGVSRAKPVVGRNGWVGRFWVKPWGGCLFSTFMNERRDLFRDNTPLRKALNWAVDRTPYAATGIPWTHLLPPDYPGSISDPRQQPYSVAPNLDKARQLAAGHLRDGNVRVAYQSAGTAGPRDAQRLRQALIGVGFDDSRIDMVGFAGFDLIQAISGENPPFDLASSIGFCLEPADRDPASILDMFVHPTSGFGPWAVNSPPYQAKLALISRRLKGAARLRALGKLDLEISRKLAPAVPLAAGASQWFFSARVFPYSLRWSPAYGWSLPAFNVK